MYHRFCTIFGYATIPMKHFKAEYLYRSAFFIIKAAFAFVSSYIIKSRFETTFAEDIDGSVFTVTLSSMRYSHIFCAYHL